MSVSQQASVAISFTHVQRTLHKSDTLFSLRSKKSATRKSLRKDNSLSRFVRRPRCSISGTFSGETRRDMTRRDAERTPLLKCQLFCWLCARARVHKLAREIFLAMTEVYQAQLSHVGSPSGGSAGLIISYFVWVQRTFRHAPAVPSPLPFHSPPRSFFCYLFHEQLCRWLLRVAFSKRRRRRLDARQIEHDRSLNRVAIYVNFRRTIFIACKHAPRCDLELVPAEKYYCKGRPLPDQGLPFATYICRMEVEEHFAELSSTCSNFRMYVNKYFPFCTFRSAFTWRNITIASVFYYHILSKFCFARNLKSSWLFQLKIYLKGILNFFEIVIVANWKKYISF